MRALLISTYEMGRQPFGLASPAAWLHDAGVQVRCLDLAVEALDPEAVRAADVVGVYLPMHTATGVAVAVVPRVRALNPAARICAWGLYAPACAAELQELGVEFLVGGEFESRVRDFVVGAGTGSEPRTGPRLEAVADTPERPGGREPVAAGAVTDLARLSFVPPDRSGLPSLDRYAHLCLPDGTTRVVGATEASRGCRHLCRHCPVVPVYRGRFRVVPADVVLADIEQLVAAGAEHITFGDPDFLNGPRHALEIAQRLHAAFPEVSYDVTAKVEHLVRHTALLKRLRDTGCVLITTAVEALDAATLSRLDKGHTSENFAFVVARCRDLDVGLQPTFLPFTPWTTIERYVELLETLVAMDLVGQVAPIQLAIRLLIPRGSRLLELPEVAAGVEPYDAAALGYPWRHEDRRVDRLQQQVQEIVRAGEQQGLGRGDLFRRIWQVARAALERGAGTGRADTAGVHGSSGRSDLPDLPARATIPYLTEPWYC